MENTTNREKMTNLWREILRVRWMLVIAVGVVVIRAFNLLPETSATLLVLYKPSLAAIGFLAAHVGYQQAFPYIDQKDLFVKAMSAPESQERLAMAWLFVGTSVLRGAIYGAFVLGVTLGL
jgi:hypothetical protein